MEEAAEGETVLLALPGVSIPVSLPPQLLPGRLRVLQGPQDLVLQWEPLEGPWDPPSDTGPPPAEDPPDPGYEPDWAVLSPPKPPPDPGWAGGFRVGLGQLRGVRRAPPGLRKPFLVLLPRGGPCPPPLHLPRGGARRLLRLLGARLRPCPRDPRLLLVVTPEDPPQPPPSPGLVTRLLQGPYAVTVGGLSRLLGGPRGGPGRGEGQPQDPPEPPFEVIACVSLGPRPSPPRGPPVTQEDWGRGLAPGGRGLGPDWLKERIFRGGLSPEMRPQGWRCLLGLQPWGDPQSPPGTPRDPPETPKDPPGTTRDPPETPKDPSETTRDPPETTKDPPETTRDPPETTKDPPETTRDPPETPKDPPETTRDPPGTTRDPPETTRDPSETTRDPPETPKDPSETTRDLLGTERGRRAVLGCPRDDYFRMKLQWRSLSSGQLRRNRVLRGYRGALERDLARAPPDVPPQLLHDILMTFCMFHFDLGYVGGMLEVLTPLVTVTPEEVEAFWGFCSIMDMVGGNFGPGREGLKRQLGQLGQLGRVVTPNVSDRLDSGGPRGFCSQWLQFRFQKQLGMEGTRRLWEVLWTGLPCPNFHLLVTCALLELVGDSPGDTPGDSDTDREDTDSEDSDGDKDPPPGPLLDVGEVLSRAEGMFLQLKGATDLPPALQELLGLGGPPLDPPPTEDPPNPSQ